MSRRPERNTPKGDTTMGRKARRAARSVWRALFPQIERPATTPASITYYRTGGAA
jgi:hypothetical protein